MGKMHDHYLEFTRKERRGIFVILSLIVLISSIPFLYPFIFRDKIIDHKDFNDEIASLKIIQVDSARGNFKKEYDEVNYTHRDYSKNTFNAKAKGSEFEFDPNTLSIDGWRKLGIREKTILTISRYLSKGGRFREAKDLKNIWGLHTEDVERLIPYVRIRGDLNPLHDDKIETKIYSSEKIKSVDINTSDTNAFISLPGIGSTLSKRIISFREKLGGFNNIEQVKETFGLPDSVFQKIRPRLLISGDFKKININSATVDEMKSHPYIRFNLANTIVQYRSQNGNYLSVTDIKKIMIVDEALYIKLSPYLIVE